MIQGNPRWCSGVDRIALQAALTIGGWRIAGRSESIWGFPYRYGEGYSWFWFVGLFSGPIALWALCHVRPGLNLHLSLAAAFAAVSGGRRFRFALMPMSPELLTIRAVRKRHFGLAPFVAGRLQAFRLFPPLVPFAPQSAHRSGAGVVAGVNFACPFGITGFVAFSFQFAAQINKLGYVYF